MCIWHRRVKQALGLHPANFNGDPRQLGFTGNIANGINAIDVGVLVFICVNKALLIGTNACRSQI